MGLHMMIEYSYSWERTITLNDVLPFAIVLQGHAGKIRNAGCSYCQAETH